MQADRTETRRTDRPDFTSGGQALALALVAGVLALGPAACGGDDGGPTDPDPDPDPTTGSIEVSASTTGEEPDPDGYTVTLDGADGQSLGVDGTVTFTDVDEGEHTLELTGVAANCAVDGANPKTRTVSAGGTATATFDVICEATTGSIEVSAATTGDTLDADGYEVALDGGTPQTVGIDGTVTFSDVTAGDHEVEIAGVQSNCTPDGGSTATVAVTAGETVTQSFDVACVPALFDRIVFASDRPTSGPAGVLNLWVMGTDGSNPTLMVGTGFDDVVGQVSPDGTELVFQSNETDDAELLTAPADPGTGVSHLTNNSVPDGQPAWSADGSQIAFVSDRDGDSGTPPNLFVMDADGTNVLQLTDNSEEEGIPSWSPDGSTIVFGVGGDGFGEVMAIAPDGTNLRNLTDDPAGDGDPAWSPDGSQIAFVSDRAATGDPEIYVMDADGSNVTRVTTTAGLERWPTWSADGTRIIYATNRSGDFDIHAINVDGTGDTNLTSGSSDDDLIPRGTPAR